MFVAFATPTAGTVGTLTQRNLSVGSLQLMQHHCIQVATKLWCTGKPVRSLEKLQDLYLKIRKR